MIIFLLTLIYFIPIKILNIDIPYISIFLNNEIFSSLFVLLCFLFIIHTYIYALAQGMEVDNGAGTVTYGHAQAFAL